jgi:DNA helicase-2/ATP-dependent DNA helicase PcrA
MAPALDLESLNPEQLEAVEWPSGPLLIFAGAGSGKTRVITFRIARLIRSGIHPSRILAVTFTNKAAREMKERVRQLVGEVAGNMWIGTFHSICSRMLRVDGQAIGLDRNFVIYDDSDQLSLIREIFKQKNIDDKSIQPRAVLSEISSAKEKMLTPEQYAERATGFFERIAADIYKSYNALLRKANALDFDDILYFAVRLLEQREDVREKYQERFLHVLVDEYQDVNFAQYQIVHLIAAKHRNVVVVGDDDQSIYAWRGADVSLILRFSSDQPDPNVV